MSAAGPTRFYLMHCVEGDECLVADFDTIEDARERLHRESVLDPRAELSIWDSRGGLLWLWDRRRRVLQDASPKRRRA
jgi:hypothetical protein